MDGVASSHRRAFGQLLAATCVLATLAASLHVNVPSATPPPEGDPVPLLKDVFGDDYVFVDPNTGVHAGTGINWHKVRVPRGNQSFLKEVKELRFDDKHRSHERTWHTCVMCTGVYLGLTGSCEMQLQAAKAFTRRPIQPGSSLVVFPGVNHRVHLNPSEKCAVLYMELETGIYTWPVKQGWFESSIDATPVVKTAHQSDLLSKQVLLTGGLVPGIFQFSIARFQPAAECEEHVHKSATEVYVGYKGNSCKIQLADKSGEKHVVDLAGGKLVVVKPGTRHKAWNDGPHPCWNINMMLGDPAGAPLAGNSDSEFLRSDVRSADMLYVNPKLHSLAYAAAPSEGRGCESGMAPVQTLEECEAAAQALLKPAVVKGRFEEHVGGCFLGTDEVANMHWNLISNDSAAHGYRVCQQKWGRKSLIANGQEPFVRDVSIVSFPVDSPGVEAEGVDENYAEPVYEDTTFYLGMKGLCRLQLTFSKYNPPPTVGGHMIRDHMVIKPLPEGTVYTVPPGMEHRILGMEDSDCVCLRLQVKSGIWFVPHAEKNEWIRSSLDEAPEETQQCQGSKLLKKRFVGAGLVPGVFELSTVRYAPKAECTQDASEKNEIHVGYMGEGCHAQVAYTTGRRRDVDLTGGSVAMVRKGTMRTIRNEGEETCWDLVLAFGDDSHQRRLQKAKAK